jgi:hypothetical protein
MTSAGLPGLLKWSVASSEASQKNGTTPVEPPQLEALAHLFGFNVGSNAESMAKSLQVAKNESGEYDLKTRIEACENFQILVEDLNNANNLHNIPQYKDGPRGLWTPLLALLDSEEPEIRSWAALCCHSAVQNNVETQEKVSTSIARSKSQWQLLTVTKASPRRRHSQTCRAGNLRSEQGRSRESHFSHLLSSQELPTCSRYHSCQRSHST